MNMIDTVVVGVMIVLAVVNMTSLVVGVMVEDNFMIGWGMVGLVFSIMYLSSVLLGT